MRSLSQPLREPDLTSFTCSFVYSVINLRQILALQSWPGTQLERVIPLPPPPSAVMTGMCCQAWQHFAFFKYHQSTFGWIQTPRAGGAEGRLHSQPNSVFPVPAEQQLAELAVEEAEALQILTQVNVVRRECEIVSVASLSGWGGASCTGLTDLFPSLPLETGGFAF